MAQGRVVVPLRRAARRKARAVVIVLLGGALCTLLAIVAIRRTVRLRGLANRMDGLLIVRTKGSSERRLASGMDAVAARLAVLEDRVEQRHKLSGLSTREPLLARIQEDGDGGLGVVQLVDFDRLCAFDPSLGERVLLVVVDRLTRMVTGSRLVAHVDRAHLAIWFDAGVDDGVARAELDAIAYALSDTIRDGDRDILPDIKVRHARYAAGTTTPQAFLSRTLASLALREGADAVATDATAVARERYALEQDLRQAVARGEFQLQYQPLVDAGEGRVCGAEALIRWRHPTHGLVPPSRFVPIAEAIGIAHDIGMWALNTAVREARAWQAQGLAGLRVAVNVSGHQLERADMATLVARTLARHGVGADAVEIELTESVAMSDGPRAAALFDALHAAGVRIAIDDFGTGYSSFSTLRTLAFDKIKIDREFVTNVHQRRDSQAICQSIVALGRGLGIRVLAEGVEQRAEYEWLRRHGCAHFQGYYFSPPLDGAAFAAFVRDPARLRALVCVSPVAAGQSIQERLSA